MTQKAKGGKPEDKNYKSYIAAKMSESRVVIELGKRDFVATTFSGNMPKIDILAFKDGVAIPIQVKTNTSNSIQLHANQFLVIEYDENKEKQKIKMKNGMGEKKNIYRHIIWVIVLPREKERNELEFYICREGDIQDSVAKHYPQYVTVKHKGRRPGKNWKSDHHGLERKHIEEFKNNWDLLDEEIAILSEAIKNARAGKS